MFTLVIFELVPEDTHLYLIPNSEIDDEKRRVLEGAHHKLINADEDVENALRLSNMLSESSPTEDNNEQEKAEHGCFKQHKVDTAQPTRDTAVTHIYLSGWML